MANSLHKDNNGKKPFYITTTLPYANGMPHIGHTLEFIRADILARYKRLMGYDVFLNTGIDEHGKKNLEKAQELSVTPQEYVDDMAGKWQEFCKLLNMDYDYFSRTTAEHHRVAVQKFWQVCADKGYIYKAKYNAKYCVGCEMEKTDSELNGNGECPDHIGKKLEQINEENYFFKYSAFEKDLLQLYAQEPSFITPDFRRNEIRNFVEDGLRDFSISRLKNKMPWGVPVPGDEKHVMYVWFDALPNYISCLGWGNDDSNFKKFWEGGTTVQFCGKDNLRPQTAMWQAMLIAANIKTTDHIVVGGHIISNGMKMSKTIGNTIDPFEYIGKYGIEAVRYFLARHIHGTQDSDFTAGRFNELYTADLVNGLGNLTARIMKMAETHLEESVNVESNVFDSRFVMMMDEFKFSDSMDMVWELIAEIDQFITESEPFKVIKTDKVAGQKIIIDLVHKLYEIAGYLTPFMPNTSAVIKQAIKENRKPKNLFERIDLEVVDRKEGVNKDIICSVEKDLAETGVNIACSVCSVPINTKRRSKALKEYIKKQLVKLDIVKMRESDILKAYKEFYKGEEFIPAAENLLNLFESSGNLPNINRIVDIYNLTSLSTLVSFGAHDLRGIGGDIVFRYTNGFEKFTPLGVSQTGVSAGEYACMDDEKILCRMDIKQCDETKVTDSTRDFLLYAQGNKELSKEQIDHALKEVCENIEKFIDGKCKMLK